MGKKKLLSLCFNFVTNLKWNRHLFFGAVLGEDHFVEIGKVKTACALSSGGAHH